MESNTSHAKESCRANQAKLDIWGVQYNTDVAVHLDKLPDVRNWTIQVHVVRILDESGHEITCARVAGDWNKAEEAASKWLNALCRVNQGKLLKYNIEPAKDQY